MIDEKLLKFGVLNSKTAVKRLSKILENILNELPIPSDIRRLYTVEELKSLILSACKTDDFDVCKVYKSGNKIVVEYNEEQIFKWINEKLIPNTEILTFEDEEIIKLFLFSLEFAFSMFEGKTKATKTQKGFRERERDIETIITNTFIGLLGEVGLKHFLKRNFGIEITLDRTISTDIWQYKSDITNAKKYISVKTTPNLEAVWAECPLGYDYGIFVKAVVPSGILLQAFAYVCGFKRLLDFSKEKIKEKEEEIKIIIENLEKRIFVQRCGNLKTSFKTFICGFFKPEESMLKKLKEELPYLGEVREERYLIPISKLLFRKEDWEAFIKNALL